MIKSLLVLRIAGQNRHLSNRDAEKVVNAIFGEIEAALARRDRVELRGFGTFLTKTRSARRGRNPKSGAMIRVPERLHAMFKMSKEMHLRLNGTAGSDLRAAFHKASNTAKPIDPKV